MIKSRMSNFLLISIIGSIILTLALNLLPRLFPNVSRRAMHHVQDKMTQQADNERPNVRVFFPWKAMIMISVGLTVLLNLPLLLR